jgi:hypothetical protein
MLKGRPAAPESHPTTATVPRLDARHGHEFFRRPHHERQRQRRIGAQLDSLPTGRRPAEQRTVRLHEPSSGCTELVERRLAHGSPSYARLA